MDNKLGCSPIVAYTLSNKKQTEVIDRLGATYGLQFTPAEAVPAEKDLPLLRNTGLF